MRLPGWRFICAVSRWTRWGQIEHGSHSRKQATLGSLHSARPLDCIQFSMSDYRRQKQVPKSRKGATPRGGEARGARGAYASVGSFSKQHESKTGSEAELEPPPPFDSPCYLRSGKLKGESSAHHRARLCNDSAAAIRFAQEKGAEIGIALGGG